MNDIKNNISGETIYSWSRLNSLALAEQGEGCFYNFYLQYIEGDRGKGNYFSEYGTLFHQTVEKLNKNEISENDINKELTKGMKSFNYKPPFSTMGESYRNALFNFFSEGHYNRIFSQYTTLEAEDEKIFNIEDIKIKGFPDLVANHSKYEFVICDYKTSKPYEGDKLHHNIMQLYLYSIPIKEKYGKYPDYLIYIFPRDIGQKEYAYPFNLDDLERTIQWVKGVVERIKIRSEWTPRCESVDKNEDFFANSLCNNRGTCIHKKHNPFASKQNTNPFGNPFNKEFSNPFTKK